MSKVFKKIISISAVLIKLYISSVSCVVECDVSETLTLIARHPLYLF